MDILVIQLEAAGKDPKGGVDAGDSMTGMLPEKPGDAAVEAPDSFCDSMSYLLLRVIVHPELDRKLVRS